MPMYVESKIKDSFSKAVLLRAQCGLNSTPSDIGLLSISARNNNLLILKDIPSGGTPIGYIAYGKITSETYNFMVHNKVFPPYMHDLNEGFIRLIYDVVIDPNWKAEAKNKVVKFIKIKRMSAYIKNEKLHLIIRKKNRFYKKYTKNLDNHK